jgi:general secretion pathway protein D
MLAGCAAQREHREGLDLLEQGRPVEAVESLRRASTMEPDNVRYRIDYLDKRAQAARSQVSAADDDRAAGRLDAALKRYREAERIEPNNARALAGVQAVESERRAAAQLQAGERYLQANQTDLAIEQVRRALKESPQNQRALDLQRALEQRVESERQVRDEQLAARAAFKRPLTLQFRDTPLRMVFDAISRLGNVNLIVDRDVKSELRTTIYVRDASIEDALDVILLQNQLEKRLLNSNTLLIYPASAAKQKELAELKVRSFQVSNIDVAFMANIIKTMIKTKDIVTDVRTNTLVMRDTPEAIALAERLIAANDLPDAEVMLEVEVLEVSSSRASEIGLKLPSSFTISTPSAGSTGSLTVGDLRALTRNDLQVSGLSATLNLMLQDGDTNILASPRIRSRNKEKARILVGDKLPVITNLISPQQAGQNSVITGSIQYVDVGIKLEVEPQVYADGDVGIKLNLEVSNVSDTIQTESGRAYQIGTRSAQSTLRLHDGETQVMAGLINDSDRRSAQKVPGIGQMPMLGRLFSNHAGDTKKSEIVLSITPRIIRPQAVVDPRYSDAWSGTETSVRDRPLRIEPLAVVKATQASTAAGQPPAPNPATPGSAAASAAPTAPAPAPTAPSGTPAVPAAGTAPAAAQTLVTPRPMPGRTPMAPSTAPTVPAAPAADGDNASPPANKP